MAHGMDRDKKSGGIIRHRPGRIRMRQFPAGEANVRGLCDIRA